LEELQESRSTLQFAVDIIDDVSSQLTQTEAVAAGMFRTVTGRAEDTDIDMISEVSRH